MHQFRTLLIIPFFLLSTACVSTTVVDVTSKPAIKAVEQLPEDQLLDVGITLFNPGVPENQKVADKKFIKKDVRTAEAAYIPYELRRVLEDTQNWGAVRVVPRATEAIDLQVGGTIIKSDGEVLVVQVKAQDATGRQWLDKKYTDVASGMSYQEEVTHNEEPFLDLYNNIANDLLQARRQLEAEQLVNIRTVSKLKFAAAISPYAFNEYYAVDQKGAVEIKRLPSDDDPMLDRIGKIRDREYAFIDLLDEHYEGFHDDMTRPYSDWRRYSYEETVALRELTNASRATTILGGLVLVGGAVMRNKSDDHTGRNVGNAAIYGGAQLIKGGLELRAESKLNSAALSELGESFGQEVQPMLVEVQGRTVELSGTADQQFQKWRELLRTIYESETGLIVPDSAMPAPELKHPEAQLQQPDAENVVNAEDIVNAENVTNAEEVVNAEDIGNIDQN